MMATAPESLGAERLRNPHLYQLRNLQCQLNFINFSSLVHLNWISICKWLFWGRDISIHSSISPKLTQEGHPLSPTDRNYHAFNCCCATRVQSQKQVSFCTFDLGTVADLLNNRTSNRAIYAQSSTRPTMKEIFHTASKFSRTSLLLKTQFLFSVHGSRPNTYTEILRR